MITEAKILRLYQEAVERGHPDPKRGVFGRISLTDMDTAYDKDGKVGLFGVSKQKAQEIGLAELDNVGASFEAMMHWDQTHIAETNDDSAGMALTAGEKDVDAYRKKLDEATKDFSENKLIWEGTEPIGFKTTPSEIETADPLEGASGVEEAHDTAKRVVAENAAESRRQSMMGLLPDPRAEFEKLEAIIKAVLKEQASNAR